MRGEYIQRVTRYRAPGKAAMTAKSLSTVVVVLLLLGPLLAILAPRLLSSKVQSATAGQTSKDQQSSGLTAQMAIPSNQTFKITVQYTKPNVFDIVVQKGKLETGGAIRVRQGDDVTLHITTDAADEFHLDGYDLDTTISPERSASLKFKASTAGRFEYQLRQTNQKLGVLEVSGETK
jgi:heme/copper-type cytochrome/quinol oxidase subunit 2